MDNVQSGLMTDLQRVKAGSYSQVSGDVLDHVLYDSVLFAATTARPSTSFFTTPIGGSFGTVSKTLQETNMTDPGKLPAGQGFVIKEIGFAFPAIIGPTDTDTTTIVTAITNILQFSVFEIRLPGRQFDLQFPGTRLLPPIMTRTNGVIVAATNLTVQTGDFLASGTIKLAAPIILGELVSFSVVQQLGSAVAANTTILNTASDVLATQVAPLQLQLRGTLVRSK